MIKRIFTTTAAAFAAFLTASTTAQAAPCAPSTFPGAWQGEVTLCQNWELPQQTDFWFLAQGSLILPYNWFVSLEQHDSRTPFIDPGHMNKLRYLPQKPTIRNRDGLPIGFTSDRPRRMQPFSGISKRWLGLTCAACHTGQIEITKNGATKRILIDGAPTMADFEGFMEVLAHAMRATKNDAAKFDRFFKAVMKRRRLNPTMRRKRRLTRAFDKVAKIRNDWNARNKGDHPYGFARLDAIGAILNEVTAAAMKIPENRRSANAPVSYPYLWDTPHYDRVQWNGSVENKLAGALGRNVGEVLGVFGGLELRRLFGHRSSINLGNLGRLEQLISTLQPPKWPENILGPIDRSAATQNKGKQAYDRLCIGCHKSTTAPGLTRPFKATMMRQAKIGTDPAMADNFAKRMSKTGKYGGWPSLYVTGDAVPKPNGRANILLGYAVAGALTREALENFPKFLIALEAGKNVPMDSFFGSGRATLSARLFRGAPTLDSLKKFFDAAVPTNRRGCNPATEACYKSRSLNGIWATAPYLHNGSVRTMRQLLLPTADRQTTFRVGSREYDPTVMGFKDAGDFNFNTALPGNLRNGHDGPAYGNQEFKDDPELLRAILEYIKTL